MRIARNGLDRRLRISSANVVARKTCGREHFRTRTDGNFALASLLDFERADCFADSAGGIHHPPLLSIVGTGFPLVRPLCEHCSFARGAARTEMAIPRIATTLSGGLPRVGADFGSISEAGHYDRDVRFSSRANVVSYMLHVQKVPISAATLPATRPVVYEGIANGTCR